MKIITTSVVVNTGQCGIGVGAGTNHKVERSNTSFHKSREAQKQGQTDRHSNRRCNKQRPGISSDDECVTLQFEHIGALKSVQIGAPSQSEQGKKQAISRIFARKTNSSLAYQHQPE